MAKRSESEPSDLGAISAILQSVTPRGMPPDVERRVPLRLAICAIVAAFLLAGLLVAEPFREVEYSYGRTLQLVLQAIGIVLSLTVALLLRRGDWVRGRVTAIGLSYQVVIGVIVWALEFAVPFAEPVHTPGVPTVCVWVLLFPMLVPRTGPLLGARQSPDRRCWPGHSLGICASRPARPGDESRDTLVHRGVRLRDRRNRRFGRALRHGTAGRRGA